MASRFLRERGYRIRLGRYLFAEHGYLAGTDEERASDINAMFADAEVDALFIARGGYGSARILGHIDYDLIRRSPKILVGYSDATALQFALLARCDLVSFCGPVASIDLARPSASATFGRITHAFDAHAGVSVIPGSWPKSIKALSPGKAEGRLVGGCLSVVVSLLGSDYFPDVTGAILFLEDIAEPPYRIDRYLTQLELSGVLSRVAGVLLGSFVRCHPRGRTRSLSFNEVLVEMFAGRPYPVLFGLPFGHIACKITLPQGVMISIDTGLHSLRFLEAACESIA